MLLLGYYYAPGTDGQRGAAYILYLNNDGTVKPTSKRIDMGATTLSPKDYFGGRAIDVLGDVDQGYYCPSTCTAVVTTRALSAGVVLGWY